MQRNEGGRWHTDRNEYLTDGIRQAKVAIGLHVVDLGIWQAHDHRVRSVYAEACVLRAVTAVGRFCVFAKCAVRVPPRSLVFLIESGAVSPPGEAQDPEQLYQIHIQQSVLQAYEYIEELAAGEHQWRIIGIEPHN